MGNDEITVTKVDSLFALQVLINEVGWENVLQVMPITVKHETSYTVIYKDI